MRTCAARAVVVIGILAAAGGLTHAVAASPPAPSGRDGGELRRWIQLLKSEDWAERYRAVEALSRMGAAAREAIPVLIPALKDDRTIVRDTAAQALGAMGTAARNAVPALRTALGDPEELVRESAATALGRIGSAAGPAVGDLVARLKDPSPRVRDAAVEALARLAPTDQKGVDALSTALKDDDPRVRAVAAGALGRMSAASPETDRAAMSALEGGEDGARLLALIFGQVLGAAPAGPSVADQQARARARAAVPVLTASLADPQPQVRAQAALGLAGLGPAARPAAPALSHALGDPDVVVRVHAAKALARIGKPALKAVPDLLRGLEDRDEVVRRSALTALGLTATAFKEVQPELLKVIEKRDDAERLWAARILGDLGPAARGALPAVVAILDDPERRTGRDEDVVSREAHRALARIGGTQRLLLTTGAQAVAFTADGRNVLTAGGGVTVWDAATGEERNRFPARNGMTASSSNGKILATVVIQKAHGEEVTAVKLFDWAQGKRIQTWPLRQLPVWALALSGDGNVVATATDRAVQLREASTGKVLHSFSPGRYPAVHLALDASGKLLAAVNSDRVVLWDTSTAKVRWEQAAWAIGSGGLAFTHDGRYLVVGNDRLRTSVVDVTTGKARRITDMVADQTAVSADDRLLAIASPGWEGFLPAPFKPGHLQLWDLRGGKLLTELYGHAAMVTALAFSPDGKTLASASSDGTVRIWGVPTVPKAGK